MSVSELLAQYGDKYLAGLLATWQMTIISFVFCLLFALVLTVLRVCPIAPLRKFADLYVQIFRNIPGVSLLIIVVYSLPSLGILLDYKMAVIVTVVMISAAFGSENFMSGINTIGIGQVEAARSLGLGFGKMLRLVIIPQALRSTVLPMTNLFIAVMLSTALGSQVPLSPNELTGVVSYVNTRTTGGIVAFMISALGYALTSLVIGYVGNKIDKKVRILR